MCHDTQHIVSHFCHLIKLFFFSYFWSNDRAVVWRYFQALFSSNFISLERSGCLASIGLDLARFGAMIVEISHPEGR